MGGRQSFCDSQLTMETPLSAHPKGFVTTAYFRLANLAKLLTSAAKAPGRQMPPPFPAEIWMQIIEEHIDRKDRSALSITCWFFHQSVQVLLYEEVVLHPPPRDIKFLVFSSKHSQSPYLLARTLKLRPALGIFLRDLTVRSSKFSHHGPRFGCVRHPVVSKPDRHPILSKLDRLPNLQRLRLWGFRIDTDFCVTLYTHPCLNIVKFTFCEFDGSLLPGTISDNYPGSRISELDIQYPYDPFMLWAALIPAGLLSLRTKLRDNLSYLPLSSAHGIPLLESYTGPHELLPFIIKGRPVHKVGLVFSKSDSSYPPFDFLLALELSSVPVTELAFYGLRWIYPGVERYLWYTPLTIHTMEWEAMPVDCIERFLPAMSRMTGLRVLIDTRNPEDHQSLEWEHIKQISDACPFLDELRTARQIWKREERNGLNLVYSADLYLYDFVAA